MNFDDVYKTMLLNRGGNVNNSDIINSKTSINRKFKNDPSYRLAKYKQSNKDESTKDIRVVNVDGDLDKKKIYILPDSELVIGDYLYFDNYWWIIEKFNLNLISPVGDALKCNQILRWKDKNNVLHEYPCVSEDDSYGAKLVKSGNDFIGVTETKTKITVQTNEFTREIGKDTRFIFSHSKEDIYKAVNINRSINEGIITITCDKDLFQNEDNLADNLAFNDYSSSKVNPTPTTYTITGSEYLSMNTSNTYTISQTIAGGVWAIDTRMTAFAQIISQTNFQCVVKPIKVNQLFILQYVDSSGNILVEKMVNTIR